MTLEDLEKKRLKQRCFYTKEEIKEILNEISLKVVVEELPELGVENYLYLVPSLTQDNYYLQYVWNDGSWEYLGENEVDLTEYVTDPELEVGLSKKQDKLISGTNIKTINNQSVLGDGNLVIKEEALEEKTYAPAEFSGLGRKYLQKNIVDVSGTDKNILTQAMVSDANTIYVIQYDYDLNGESISIPSGCVLQFDGGSLRNGTLVGKLMTDKSIDLRELGVIYNDSTKASQNTNALKILASVTNDLQLNVSGEVWLGGQTSIIMKSINLEGNGNTIHIDGFGGFIVSDGVNVHNARIVTEAWSTSKDYFNQFAQITNVTNPTDLIFSECYFEGSMRICTGIQIADGTSYDVCLGKIEISNCVFENIACGNTTNILFRFDDTNFLNTVIKNNSVHNMYCMFSSFGITNNSIYEDYIANFVKDRQRLIVVENNDVSNDLDFMPWTKLTLVPSYFCFILAELGVINFTDNKLTNIIGNSSSNPTYDAYLSVDELYYQRNYVRNVLSLVGENNEIFKSKGGGANKIRYYADNTFILEDLSSHFDGVDFMTIYYMVVNTMNKSKKFVIKNNIIDFTTLYLNANLLLSADYLLVQNNIINITNPNTKSEAALFPLYEEGEKAYFENNTVSVIAASTNLPLLFGQGASSASKHIYVIAQSNNLKNVVLCRASDATAWTGLCSNNNIQIDYNAFSGINSSYFYKCRAGEIEFKANNISIKNAPSTGLRICEEAMNFEVVLNLSVTNILLTRVVPSGISHILVEIYNELGQRILLSELNVSKNESTTTFSGYDTGGTFISSSTATTNLYNYMGTSTLLQINSAKFLYIYYAPSKIRVKMSYMAESVEKFIYHPTKGTSTSRPTLTATDAGFQYWDTTLGKMIAWNGSAWVNLDGTALA